MKNKISLLTIVITALFFFIGCSKGERPTPSNNASNNNNTNTATTGAVAITVSWNAAYLSCSNAWHVECGLGYTSNDVSSGAYFTSQTGYNGHGTFTFSNLAAGIYYYKAKKIYNLSGCGGANQPSVEHLGSFTITAGQTTTLSFFL